MADPRTHHFSDDTPSLPPAAQSLPETRNGYGNGPRSDANAGPLDQPEVMCGPLLNYKGMNDPGSDAGVWYGSVLLVMKPAQPPPDIRYKRTSSPAPSRANAPKSLPSTNSIERISRGDKLYEDPVAAFWRFALEIPLHESGTCWEYSIPGVRYSSGSSPRNHTFVVPAVSQSMRIMFHSCNGFSVGTDEDAWSGPALWNDVLRLHDEKPFHVMIGGGDQIYNDGVRVDKGPLREWTDIGNPHKRREYPFTEELRKRCDDFYFNNYVRWFSTEPFKSANGQIPQVNIWDDHDIIDGFGSYTDHFMHCPVFKGIGGISFKYYCLFQHHIPPSKPTYTSPAPQTHHFHRGSGGHADTSQLSGTFMRKIDSEDECFILGKRPGPYISELSRSLYMNLGARIGFVGLDARTERTRREVNYPDTYDLIFERLEREMSRQSPNKMTHLIVLLGVPIAYPRLAWLETIFKSPIIGPIRFLSRRFGIGGSFFNKFDGQVELLDDLDDHYTTHQHKHERRELILRLQALALEHSIRITILGGDVHLAAVGRFYANPRLGVDIAKDYRYMANLVSSAITNHPPPKAIADLLARRNKIHHLDHETDETLMKLFDKSPGGIAKASSFNKVTMPSRNYAVITESTPASMDGRTNGHVTNGNSVPTDIAENTPDSTKEKPKDGHYPLHYGEEGAGVGHVAARGSSGNGGLDICFRVEIDQHDREGKCEGYGFSIPPLEIVKGQSGEVHHRHLFKREHAHA